MPSLYLETAAVVNNLMSGEPNEYLPYDAQVTIAAVAVTDTDKFDLFMSDRQVAKGIQPNIEATAHPIIPDNVCAKAVGRAGQQIRIPVTAVTTKVRMLVDIEPI